MKKVIKKLSKKVPALLLSLVLIFSAFPLAAPPANAATPTKENAIVFTVRGTVDSGGVIRYNIVVDGVYAQDYQSFTVTYPKELKIDPTAINSDNLGATWIVTNTENTSPRSCTFIIRTGTRSAEQLKADLESISFTLENSEVFPPDGSTVAITASQAKTTYFMDKEGYAHYYEWVPFNVVDDVPQAGANNSTNPLYFSWWKAYNEAQSKSMQDPRHPDDPSEKLQGYLATITSEEEQMRLYSAIADWSGWLGGTRQVQSSGNKKLQDTKNIPTDAGSYSYTAAQNRWYWSNGPEAWTVYNTNTDGYKAGGPAYQYYPKGLASVPANGWSVYNSITKTYTYLGPWDEKPNVENLGDDEEVVEDPNRGAAIGPLEFYNNNVYAAATRYTVNGVYSNWNNPEEGTVHVYNANKVLAGTTPGGGKEPNGTTNEYCLQFAYPSGTFSAGGSSTTKPDTWNDYAATNTNLLYGFFVEYGGYPGDPKADDLGGANITTTSEVEMVMPIVIQYRSTVQNPDGTYRYIKDIKDSNSKDRIITYENHLPFTAYRETEKTANDMFDPPVGYKAYGYKFIGDIEDENNLTVNAKGDIDGFHSTHTQRIIFLYQPDTYTVTFDANFDNWNSANVSPGSKMVSYDSPYGSLATATRPGYTLKGWFKDPVNGTQVTEDDIVTELGNHTLYAHWEVKGDYSVEYDVNDSTSAPVTNPVSFQPKNPVSWIDNSLVPEDKPVRPGFVFTGWNVSYNGEKQGVTNADTYGDLANNDADDHIVLQAQWIRDGEKTVIYHTNGGTPAAIPDAVLEDGNEPVDFPEVTRTGHTFTGWQVADKGDGTQGAKYPAGEEGYRFSDISAADANFVILEAQWSANNYQVNYDKNDNGDTPSDYDTKTVLWDENGLTPPPNHPNPTREGYLFMGWNTQRDGSGVSAYVGTAYSQLAQNDDKQTEITLYAQWAAERTFSVKYNTNGGTPSVIPDKEGVFLGSDKLLPRENEDTPITMTPPDGYTFSGWSVSYNGSKTGVTDDDKFSELVDDSNIGYIILQAQYSPKNDYEVQYDTQNGTPAMMDSKTEVVWTQISLLPPVDPSRSGYNFLGWYTQPNGGGIKASAASSYKDLAGGTDQPSITLYAHWAQIKANEYTVRYNSNGGSAVEDQVLTSTEAPVPAPVPTPPTGYQFNYWEIENNGNEQGTKRSPKEDGTTPYSGLAYRYENGDYANFIILKAVYSEISNFTVKYDWNYEGAKFTDETGGENPPDELNNVRWTQSGFTPYSWNDSGTMKPVSRPGYNLTGWTTNPDGTGTLVIPGTQYKALAGGDDSKASMTLYAQWEKASFLVQYDTNGGTPPASLASQYGTRTVGYYDINLLPESFDRPGYELAGWNVIQGGSKANVTQDQSYGELADPGEPFIVLQAQWRAKDYTVKYNLDGGHVSGSTKTTIDQRDDIKWYTFGLLPSESVEKMGYTFKGWMLSEIGNTLIQNDEAVTIQQRYQDLAGQQENDNGSITLKAIWEVKSGYQVNYDLNGGYLGTDTSVEPQKNLTWESDDLLPGTVTKAGYTFAGWNVTAGGNGEPSNTNVLKTAAYGDLAQDDDTKEITLTAQWTEGSKVTITYEKQTQYFNGDNRTENDGGTIPKTSEEVNPVTGSPSVLATNEDGYTFEGWFKKGEDGSLTKVSDAKQFQPPKTQYADGEAYEAATYVAVFKEEADITINYKTYNLNQADSNAYGSIDLEKETLAPVTGTITGSRATAKPGYDFMGWFEEDTDYEGTALSKADTYKPGKTGNVYEAKTYVAVFKEKADITINYETFNLNTSDPKPGGKVDLGTETLAPVTGGTATGSKATPAAGYDFMGWFVKNGEDDYTGEPFEANATLNPDKSTGAYVSADYVAVFKEKSAVTIKYEVANQNASDPNPCGSVDPKTETLLPVTGTITGSKATPEPGYDFVGWYKREANESLTKIDGATAEFKPSKTKYSDGDEAYEAATYVAVFKEKADITIKYETFNLKSNSSDTNPGGEVTLGSETLAPVTGTITGSTAIPAAGYDFVGWFEKKSDDDYTGKPLPSSEKLKPQKNGQVYEAKTYVAVFQESADITINYETYNLNPSDHNPYGSVDPMAETIHPATETASGSTATPSTGYDFVGWFVKNQDDDYTGKPIETDQHFDPDKSTGAYQAETYVAVFKEKADITISYETYNQNPSDPNAGGEVSPKSEKLPPVTGIVTGSTATPSAGYDFVGWFEKGADYTGSPIESGLKLEPQKPGDVFVEKTYVAVFKEKANVTINYETYNLNTLDPNLGGSISSKTESVAPVTGTADGSNATPAAGYEFVGWFVKSTAGYDPTAPIIKDLTYKPKQVSGVYQPETYVAVFREKANVTMDYSATAGGKVNPVTEGVSPVLGTAVGSTATANPGYALVGWFDVSDKQFVQPLSTDAHFIPKKVGGLNVTGSYVAKFEEAPDITVDYIATPGGTVSRDSETTPPVTGTLKGATAKVSAGYDFIGWYDGNNGKKISDDLIFVPAKTSDGVYASGTYIAMFAEKVTVTANYKVEHYVAGSTTPFNTETFNGVIKSTVTAVPKNYPGYTYQDGAAGEVKSGTVAADGSLTLKLYYAAATHQIKYEVIGTVPAGAVDQLPTVPNVAYGTTQTVKAAPTFAGYTFSGWQTIDCMVDDQGKFTMPDSDVKFIGTWIPNTASAVAGYKVEHYLEGTATPYETETLQGTVGADVYAHIKDYDGYSFDSGNASNVIGGEVLVNGDLVLKVYYALNKHNVKYEIQGGAPAGAPTVPDVPNVPYGSTQEVASSSSMVYAGYVFTIWGTKDCTVQNGEFTMPDTDVTFVGSWVPLNGSQQASYTVEHYLNGTLHETETYQGVDGTTVSAMPKTGYAGYSYDSGNASNVESGTVSANNPLVLKLYYTSDTYSIEYEIGGQSYASDSASYGDAKAVEPEPTNPGFTFSGWHTADCAVNADGTYTMPDHEITFYGEWIPEGTISVAEYKVEHYLVDAQGTATLHETEQLKGLSNTTATAVPKNGYEGYVYDDNYDDNVPSGVILDNGSLVLKLYYVPAQYKITYSITGDVPPGATTSMVGGTAAFGNVMQVMEALRYPGYTFSGWQTADCTVTNGSFDMPGHDVAFVGTWTKNPEMLTVEFKDWDGSILNVQYVPYGWDATAPTDPTRSGYTFTGWDIAFTNVTKNITVQAQYSENTKDGPSQASDNPSSSVPSGSDPGSDNPGGGSNSQVPPTGDSAHMLLWALMLMASALGVLVWRKRTRNVG